MKDAQMTNTPIPLIEKFQYQDLQRITLPEGRYYVSPEGEHLQSVTTILDKTSDNTFLIEWKKRIGEVEAEKQTKFATGLGSLMHEHLENYVQGLERPTGSSIVWKQAEKMANQIIARGLPHITEIWGMEKILYYPGLYAGTTDLVGCWKGVPSIIDYKTSKKMKTEEQIENYKLQACAYAMAHNELYGTDIKQGVILMVSRDFEYQEFIVDTEEYMNKWLARLDIFYNS